MRSDLARTVGARGGERPPRLHRDPAPGRCFGWVRVWQTPPCQLPAGCNLQGSSPQPRIKPLRGDPWWGEGQEGSQGWHGSRHGPVPVQGQHPPAARAQPLSSSRPTTTRARPPSTTTSTCRRGPSSRPSAGRGHGASTGPAPGALPAGAELRSLRPQAGAESPLRHLPQRGGCFPGS